MLVCHRDVRHGEHHEDERLNHHDQDVEDRPAQAKDRARRGSGEPRRTPPPEQNEDDFAGEHVVRTVAGSARAAWRRIPRC